MHSRLNMDKRNILELPHLKLFIAPGLWLHLQPVTVWLQYSALLFDCITARYYLTALQCVIIWYHDSVLLFDSITVYYYLTALQCVTIWQHYSTFLTLQCSFMKYNLMLQLCFICKTLNFLKNEIKIKINIFYETKLTKTNNNFYKLYICTRSKHNSMIYKSSYILLKSW